VKSRLQDWPRPMRLSLRFHAVSLLGLLLISGCAFLNKRPPYPDPDRLVSVVKVATAGEEPVLGADFLALRNESRTLEPIAGYVLRDLTLSDGSAPERIRSALVSAGFFPALGVEPALGRALTSQDSQSGVVPVVVISHELWQRRFGADPSMIGRTITLNQERYTVVGVMPADFQFPKECGMWTPLAFDYERELPEDNSLELEVIARLKPGVTLEQAQTEVSNIARNLVRVYPEINSGRDIKLVPLRDSRSK
jgi:putative ABC transport system permease protein